VRLSRPSGRPPLLATLLPIGGALPGLRAPQVAVFIAEPDAPPALDRAALADTYRLTCRETEIAALLAGGLALETIAARLGIGIGTARNHLKRVFDKTGTSSQAALVASLRGLTQWLR
jgi:DNA-binding CsgD family transcriptional regulator